MVTLQKELIATNVSPQRAQESDQPTAQPYWRHPKDRKSPTSAQLRQGLPQLSGKKQSIVKPFGTVSALAETDRSLAKKGTADPTVIASLLGGENK